MRCVETKLTALTFEEQHYPTLYYRICESALPSMPMSNRLDVSCPQFLWACCLLIQFQLKPRKSRTIFFPTVSFKVCCRYTLEMHERRDKMHETLCSTLWDLKQDTMQIHFWKCYKMCLKDMSLFTCTSMDYVSLEAWRTTWHWRTWTI